MRKPIRAVAERRKNHTIQTMPMTVDQVLAETSRWPSGQVDELIERLLLTNHRLTDPTMDKGWAEEIKRRIDDIESGREVGIPGEDVMAHVRKIVGL
jgi:putative addiction module component (TIGR02574 family)